MAGHKGPRGGGGQEPRGSDKPYHITGGKLATPVDAFSNGILGTPGAPKMRGDTKHVGTGTFPTGEGKSRASTGALGAFGIGRKGKA